MWSLLFLGCIWYLQERDAAHPPHQAGPRPQLLRILLRDPQQPRQGLSACQAGIFPTFIVSFVIRITPNFCISPNFFYSLPELPKFNGVRQSMSRKMYLKSTFSRWWFCKKINSLKYRIGSLSSWSWYGFGIVLPAFCIFVLKPASGLTVIFLILNNFHIFVHSS